MRPLIFNLGVDEALLQGITTGLGADRGSLVQRSFPDGESYVRFATECDQRQVIVVCSLDRPDGKTVRALLAADTLRDLGASTVGLVAPYLAYMRQDRQFRSGEGITARYYAKLLSAHFDWLVTVDPHLHRVHALDEIYTIPSRVVHAAPLLGDWIRDNVRDPVLVGPDSESQQWVSAVAGRARVPYLVLEKVRTGDRRVRVSIPSVEGHRHRVPVLVDDIISTGRTLVATIEHLAELGMPAPICVAVHGVFAEGALEDLRRAGATKVVTCNTVKHETNAVDVSKSLATTIAELVNTPLIKY